MVTTFTVNTELSYKRFSIFKYSFGQ